MAWSDLYEQVTIPSLSGGWLSVRDAFSGIALAGNGKLYCPPAATDRDILVIEPDVAGSSDSTYRINMPTGADAFRGAITVGDLVVAGPRGGFTDYDLVKIDTTDDSVSVVACSPTTGMPAVGTLVGQLGGELFLFAQTGIVKLNIGTGAWTLDPWDTDLHPGHPALHPNGNIYMVCSAIQVWDEDLEDLVTVEDPASILIYNTGSSTYSTSGSTGLRSPGASGANTDGLIDSDGVYWSPPVNGSTNSDEFISFDPGSSTVTRYTDAGVGGAPIFVQALNGDFYSGDIGTNVVYKYEVATDTTTTLASSDGDIINTARTTGAVAVGPVIYFIGDYGEALFGKLATVWTDPWPPPAAGGGVHLGLQV